MRFDHDLARKSTCVTASHMIAYHLDDWGPKGGHERPYWHHQMWEYVGAHF